MTDVILERHGKFQWRECRFCGCAYPYPEKREHCDPYDLDVMRARKGDQ